MGRDFEIPPQQNGFALVNICPTAATEKGTPHFCVWVHAVYAFVWTPAFHRALPFAKKIVEIGRIDKYVFDNQQTYTLARWIKTLPGDAFVVTTCTFVATNI